MFTFAKWIAAPVLAIGLMYAADAQSAKAQYGCYGYGGGLSIGIGVGRYGVGRYGVGGYHSSLYRSRYGGVGLPYYGHHRYSHRGHYDWHPTTVIPHGNHFDVYPGHWDYHRGHHGHHGRHH